MSIQAVIQAAVSVVETAAQGDFPIQVVFRRVDEVLRAELAAFWLAHKVIGSAAEGQRRAGEAVCVIRDAHGALAGVNTAYLDDFERMGWPYYFFRMFVREADHPITLPLTALHRAVDVLRNEGKDAAHGIVIVIENPKLAGAMAQWALTPLGFVLQPRAPGANETWKLDFAPA